LTVVLDASSGHIPPHLTTTLSDGVRVMAKAADGWCVALDRVNRNCGIYDSRPTVCRKFVMGGAYCRAIFTDRGAEAASEPR